MAWSEVDWMWPLVVVFLNSTLSSGLLELGVGLAIQSPTRMWQSYSSGRHGMLDMIMFKHCLLEGW